MYFVSVISPQGRAGRQTLSSGGVKLANLFFYSSHGRVDNSLIFRELDPYAMELPNRSTDVELSTTFDRIDENAEFSLPPADGGSDAWKFLASTFIFEALTWGS